MPQVQQEKRRNSQLDAYVIMLAERLAIAVAYLCAIDDTVDPLRRKGAAEYCEMDWAVATLAMRARSEIFEAYRGCDPYKLDCSDVIEAAKRGQILKIRETEVYAECLSSVRQMLRSGNEASGRRGASSSDAVGSAVETPARN